MKKFILLSILLFMLIALPVWGQFSPIPPQRWANVYTKPLFASHSQSAISSGPNLTIADVAIWPDNAQPGDEVTLTVTVENTGDETIDDHFSVELSISPSLPDTANATGEAPRSHRVIEAGRQNLLRLLQACQQAPR